MLTTAVVDVVGVDRGESAESPVQYGGLYRIWQHVGIRTCKDVVGVECQHDDAAVAGAHGLQCIGNVVSEGTCADIVKDTNSATMPLYETGPCTHFCSKIQCSIWTTSEQ